MNHPRQEWVPGIIGVAVRTDQVYYTAIHEPGSRNVDGRRVNSLKTSMCTVDFVALIEMLRSGDREGLESEMLDVARRLRASGADFLVLTANTFHAHLGKVRADQTLPILDVVDASCDTAAKFGFRKLGIVSTSMTVAEELYQRAAAARGLQTVVPRPDTRVRLDKVIFSELIAGVFSDTGVATLRQAVEELQAAGADCALLACTDLTHVAARLAPSKIPLIDTTRLHALYAANAALSGKFEIASLPAELGAAFLT